MYSRPRWLVLRQRRPSSLLYLVSFFLFYFVSFGLGFSFPFLCGGVPLVFSCSCCLCFSCSLDFFFGSRIPFVCHLSCSSSPNMVDSDGWIYLVGDWLAVCSSVWLLYLIYFIFNKKMARYWPPASLPNLFLFPNLPNLCIWIQSQRFVRCLLELWCHIVMLHADKWYARIEHSRQLRVLVSSCLTFHWEWVLKYLPLSNSFVLSPGSNIGECRYNRRFA